MLQFILIYSCNFQINLIFHRERMQKRKESGLYRIQDDTPDIPHHSMLKDHGEGGAIHNPAYAEEKSALWLNGKKLHSECILVYICNIYWWTGPAGRGNIFFKTLKLKSTLYSIHEYFSSINDHKNKMVYMYFYHFLLLLF